MTAMVDPDRTDPKLIVNDKLMRIKSEFESQYDDFDDDDLSQEVRPQQFYKDLDDNLACLPRDQYVNELLKLCKNNYNDVNDYRQRLAERTSVVPDCPKSRLVNRRNSSHASREKKCANDCYILNAFLNGVRSKEIFDVYTNTPNSNNEPIFIEDDTDPRDPNNDFIKADALAILTLLRSDINDIWKRQNADSAILNEVRKDVSQMAITFRTFQGTLNSILSRTPTQTPTHQVAKLQKDITQLGSSFAVMNKRFLDIDNDHTENITGPIVEPGNHEEATNAATFYAEPQDPTHGSKSYAEVVTSPKNALGEQNTRRTSLSTTLAKQPSERHKQTPTSTKSTYAFDRSEAQTDPSSSNIMFTAEKLPLAAHETSETIDELDRNEYTPPPADTNPNRFIAARRRKITSYFIGNIDTSVTEADVADFLKLSHVKPTQITMFYGKTGSSARINFHHADEEKIEGQYFWPSRVTCRKWVSKTEWEREREEQRRSRRENYYKTRYRNNRYSRDTDYDYGNHNRDRHHDSGSSRFDDERAGRYTEREERNPWQGDIDDDW